MDQCLQRDLSCCQLGKIDSGQSTTETISMCSTVMKLQYHRLWNYLFRWEKEKIIRKNRPQEEDNFGEKDLDSEKQRDLEGSGSDDIPEPEEVRVARQELLVLQEEKAKTEGLKSKVQKELEQAKKRAARIEEVWKILNFSSKY